jgi:hypothetical protein
VAGDLKSDAAISPDGKYVAHVKSDAGQQSLWLRQVTTTSDTQIVPPSPQKYSGITFAGALANLVNVCDVRMVESRRRCCFLFESTHPIFIGDNIGGQNL